MYLERLNIEGEAAKTVIYFIQRKDGVGPVKIGCSSDLQARLQSLIARRQEELVVLASATATFRDEGRIHKLFATDQLYGEWFTLSAAISQAIADINVTGVLPEVLKCSARAARLDPSVSRIMGLDTAAGMLGSRNDLAAALGIQARSLRHKMTADRGISDADIEATAAALEARAARISAHAAKLREQAAIPQEALR